MACILKKKSKMRNILRRKKNYHIKRRVIIPYYPILRDKDTNQSNSKLKF